ncbi:DUF6011 domain-containing protein [Streptomyces sp. NRRL B-24484]|uniref:DUF6011 domain-containing protein n=1 Tax=Streptomyces sp. NRRL B-24484 TaxID=1463833 RepID=UPI0005B8C6B3|nr:DUF6011 domain-containing protein [Streptomyces sp. NRRL B-24484]
MSQPALIPPVPPRLPERVRCRRCGRPLHDPLSRMLRLGRECRGPQEPVRVVEGDQETLPGLASPAPTPAPTPAAPTATPTTTEGGAP